MSRWRSMKSAPTAVGSCALIWANGAAGEAHLCEEHNGRYEINWYWANCYPTDHQDSRIYHPEAWQPLPGPPKP